jgi:hypothetical protein
MGRAKASRGAARGCTRWMQLQARNGYMGDNAHLRGEDVSRPRTGAAWEREDERVKR